MTVSIAGRAEWLNDPPLQALLAALSKGTDKARIAGGAVRNALLGEPVSDIDIATTTVPEETSRRAAAAGFKLVPTGIEHGTVTAVADGKAYEVTTLRSDIETDGRRAKVRFGTEWKDDAERRDFTINALYAEADGTVIDLVGGVADLESRTLRFIGDAEARIREDYLRILRFYRFFALYGRGRPDAAGVKATARLKDGIEQLSAERVWAELRKLLAAPDPSRALLWMRQAGVLTKALPESEKWGIDAIHGLVAAEASLGWTADPIARLEAIVPPDRVRMADLSERLKLSGADASRLEQWASADLPKPGASEGDLARLLYRGKPQGIVDRLALALAAARVRAVQDDAAMMEAGGYARLLAFARNWKPPEMPVKGRDLADLGFASGPHMGKTLKRLEEAWITSGFALGRDALLERARTLLAE